MQVIFQKYLKIKLDYVKNEQILRKNGLKMAVYGFTTFYVKSGKITYFYVKYRNFT